MKRTPPDATEAACEGCGKRVLWIVAANGARVPLDPVAPTYQLEVVDDGSDDREPAHRWARANEETTVEPAFVSHFATCAKANQFSKGRKP